MKEPIYYLDGRFLARSQAKVSVWDMGFLRSYGAVDFLITYNQKPFRLDDHLARFYMSSKLLGIKIPKEPKELKKIVFETLVKNNFEESAIWLIVTGGVGPTSMIPAKKANLIIMVDPNQPYPVSCYQEGVKIITFKGNRLLPAAKSMIYTLAIKALNQAYEKKAVEALYLDKGRVTECMTSNFFSVKKGELFTAKDKDVLWGITRQVVLEICKNNFKVVKKDLSLREVLSADEAFLTASNKEIMPVVQIDEQHIGNGRVGLVTKKLSNLFHQQVEKKLVSYSS